MNMTQSPFVVLCTSLNLSQQLKNAGTPQISLYSWENRTELGITDLKIKRQWWELIESDGPVTTGNISAYTAEEVLRFLPPGCRVYRPGVHTNEWLAESPYVDIEEDDDAWTGAESAANSCAKLYLILKKKGTLA